MRSFIVLLAAALLAGCSGGAESTGGGGNTGGALSGDAPFAVSSGIAWIGSEQGLESRTFDLSKDAYTCDEAREDGGFQASNSFFASVIAGTITAASISPGHYPDDAGGRVSFFAQVASGNHVQLDLASEGTIDLEAVEPNLKGTFTARVSLEDGGSQNVSGSFDAPYCQP